MIRVSTPVLLRSRAAHLGVLLSACLGANSQVTITHQVTIQPIRVSNGVSTANPNLTLFEEATDMIWAQAQIDVRFLTPVVYTSSTFYNLSSNAGNPNSLQSLANTSGHGQNASASVINLWFVDKIDNNSSILGFTLQSEPLEGFAFTVVQNGIAIANSAFTVNGGQGAANVIAHELGHSLGLNHSTFGASGQLNLMSTTTFPPDGMYDIYPFGDDHGQLNTAQINQARSVSQYVLNIPDFNYTYTVPEPSSMLLTSCLLGVVGICLRRLRR